MRFWDSSALVPLVVDENVWCLTTAEVWSAVARKRRERRLTSPALRMARARLHGLAADWTEVVDVIETRRRVARLLDHHPLRAADALQLAAALFWTKDQPRNAVFVTLDERLGEAADREGFATSPA